MMTDRLKRTPILAIALLLAAAAGACAIQLRGGEDPRGEPATAAQQPDSLAPKLAQCRTVSSEQKDALLGCRKAWAEQRRQFLSQKNGALPQTGGGTSDRAAASAKDESRLPSGDPSIPARGDE